MKIIFTSFLLFSLVISVFSQNNMTNETKHTFNSLKISLTSPDKSELLRLKEKLPIREMFGKEILACVGILSDNFESDAIIIGSKISNYASLYVPLNSLEEVFTNEGIKFIQVASKIQPLIEEAVDDVKADSVHLGIGLDQSYTGKNVMIGITDWGFNYSHPNFYDTLLQDTRIHAVWDHYRTAGNTPNNFNYGVEYSNSADIISAATDTFNVYEYAYHGSHVAGIAAGSGAGVGKELRGVAFDSDLLFVTFYHDEASVMDAYSWMKEKADAEGKRLVGNMSWGLYHLGNLDGTSLLGQILQAFTDENVVFVTSGGNNGNVNFHLEHTFNNDEILTKVDFYPYSAHPKMWGQSISMWGEPTESFETSFEVRFGSTVVGTTPWYNTDTTFSYIDSFLVHNMDTVFYNLSMDSANLLNNRPHARLRIKNTHTNLVVLLKAKASSGKVHFWNVVELTNDLGNWGMPFSLYGTNTVAGNKQYGIGEPACNDAVITVGSYLANYTSTNGSTLGGQMSNFSSEGPTLDDRIKPDISAPGQGVKSSLNLFATANPTVTDWVTFNGADYPFGNLSGTSMSSPVVAGVVALMLEANPNLTPQQIKEFIQLTARLDDKTGSITAPGSTEWGYGKINAYEAIQAILGVGGVEENTSQSLIVYPNPTRSSIYLGGLKKDAKYSILSVFGKKVEEGVTSSTLSLDNLSEGMYYLKIEIEGNIEEYRIIKID